MDLKLLPKEVVVWNLVGRQEGTRLHMAEHHGAPGRHWLALHFEAVRGVREEDLPQGLAGGRGQDRHLLVPGELGGGQSRDKLAVHVRRPVDLGEGMQLATEVLAVVYDVIVEAVVGVRPLQLKDIPDAWCAIRPSGQDPSIVAFGHRVEGVGVQKGLGLVVGDHHPVAKVQHAVRRGRELGGRQRRLELLLLGRDDEGARLLLLQVVLELDLLKLQVLAPVADASPGVVPGSASELLGREVHLRWKRRRGAQQSGWHGFQQHGACT
mmetsp:Transcript_97164/g.258207  ORF Transcript_97164/g.258207 Transcript_97164/m.258207 type:complete len:267 (-) Transcript_97164:7-807(-)